MKKPSSVSGKGRRRQLTVVDSRGNRQRFLRGMITHDLVQRGLSFDDAYAIAKSIRGQLGERQDVTTGEIRDRILQTVTRSLGEDTLLSPTKVPPQRRYVIGEGERLPFSRGVLARSIQAAGIDADRSYFLVTELERQLADEGIDEVRREDLMRRIAEIIERFEGRGEAQRYRLMRRIQRLPRPLVIYIGGASGTGKSTLGLALAPLLRIYRVTATDTIRQMMRMVFSPQIMPELHVSSFETQDTGRGKTSEKVLRRRVIKAFQQQATRVGVGVRAVVERAMAENMSLLVEGVHLYPPMVPFADLDDDAFQIALMLNTSDIEVHRQRFLKRSLESGRRRAERYLQHFDAIRHLQDFLLQGAETHDVPLLDTAAETSTESQALRWITELLRRRVPDLSPQIAVPRERVPCLMLVIDGLADRPVRALAGRTPLQAAETPTLDRLAREGRNGLADPVAPGVVPDTAAGSLALFGQSPLALRRGPVEALGAHLDVQTGDVALRANFATIDEKGRVIDRRAGRIRKGAEELARALDRLAHESFDGVEVRVQPATEHRLAILLRGDGLASDVRGSDPGDDDLPAAPRVPESLDPDDKRSTATARVLALFEQEARAVLADHPVNDRRRKAGQPIANAVLTRGAGQIHRLLPLERDGIPLRMSCISGDRTLLGLAGWLGARPLTDDAMTANLDTNLGAKLETALEALETDDLVVLHVKGADIAAHDGRPELKAEFLERVDGMLEELLRRHEQPLRIAVAADHATLSESGQHGADPVPVMLWGSGVEADDVQTYDEMAANEGGLERFPLQLLAGKLLQRG